MLVAIIDVWSLSSRPVTHEAKTLGVTVGSRTSKVIFNVISSQEILYSSLDCLSLFYIIHKWIDIQGVFTLKHHNTRP